jgi:hypothetical protein
MSAMRLASSFFASLPNCKVNKHHSVFKIDIPNDWTWFFLNRSQLFLFFKDPTHLVTKWRNRLFSPTAKVRIGNDSVSMTLIENLINLLRSNPDANGMVVYLSLLKMVVKAYIDKSTSTRESEFIFSVLKRKEFCTWLGIQSAWCVVFVCRLWWSWLQKRTSSKPLKINETIDGRKSQINNYFITRPAYISAELNAHYLLYLVLLVKQKRLPKQVFLNIHLFNSQPCESIFRDARSLSGTFSTRVNFTVKTFMQRSRKLSILNQIKYNPMEKDLFFPVHHKHKREHSLSSSYQLD